MAAKNTDRKTNLATANWKKNKRPLYTWVPIPLHAKLKAEARAREIPLRLMVSSILERAAAQL